MQFMSQQEIENNKQMHTFDLQVLLDVLCCDDGYGDLSVKDTIIVRAQYNEGNWICKCNTEHVDYGDQLNAKAAPFLRIVGARIHPDLLMYHPHSLAS